MTTAFDEAGECPHGMGDPAWCTLCNGADRKRSEAEHAVVATFRAKYPGFCAVCDEVIVVRQMIARLGSDRIVHEDCAKR